MLMIQIMAKLKKKKKKSLFIEEKARKALK